MKIPYYQVNAFTREVFGGNPAGVCVLEKWLPDRALQSIAEENGFSETAYFVPQDGHFHLRWFTPAVEVDLCGHATLATAFVIFSERKYPENVVKFQSRSGSLIATLRGDIVELDFPSRPPVPGPVPDDLVRGLGRTPREVLRSRDYVAVFDSEEDVAAIKPDMAALERLEALGIIVTAPGHDCDFVSRFFAPRAGVPEDPVTGSAHCSLIPFWAGRLGKPEMFARQISKRGGELHCRNAGDRVGIGGHAVTYCRGEIEVSAE